MLSSLTTEIAITAARLIVDEGLEYGPAKRRAAKLVCPGQLRASSLPSNMAIEVEVHNHIALFCADTQPHELHALRLIAIEWMERLHLLRPHLTGAAWRGTATRLSSVHLQLFCNDSKEAEIEFLNQNIPFDLGSTPGPRGQLIDVLTVSSWCPQLKEHVSVHLSILDFDDLRGALKPDAQGQTERGSLAPLRQRMAAQP
jgi:hypothetical protein